MQWLREHRQLRQVAREAARDLTPPPPAAWAAFGRSVLLAPSRVSNPECIEVGNDVVILENVWMSVVRAFPDVTPRVAIEDGVRVGRGCMFAVVAELVVEAGAIIGDFSLLADTFHPFEVEDRLPVVVRGEPVRIGAGAVLGHRVIVLPGVTIGAGARIEDRAVVSANVAPGEYYAGHPAWRARKVRA
jgi:acetyltransferase-like isoleucine patch superfamily enzyme